MSYLFCPPCSCLLVKPKLKVQNSNKEYVTEVEINHIFLSPFSIAHMDICLGPTAWDWTTYHGSRPGRKLILLLQQLLSSPSSVLFEVCILYFQPAWIYCYILVFLCFYVLSLHFFLWNQANFLLHSPKSYTSLSVLIRIAFLCAVVWILNISPKTHDLVPILVLLRDDASDEGEHSGRSLHHLLSGYLQSICLCAHLPPSSSTQSHGVGSSSVFSFRFIVLFEGKHTTHLSEWELTGQ